MRDVIVPELNPATLQKYKKLRESRFLEVLVKTILDIQALQ